MASTLASGTQSDVAQIAVPAVLIAGVLALFAFPSIGGGPNFSDARMLLNLMGAGWLLWLGWLGMGVGIIAAVFLRPDSPYHRQLLMAIGPLLGLAIPLAFRIHLFDRNESSGESFLGWIGWGPLLFGASCVIASVIGFGKYVVPIILTLGLGALIFLPGYAETFSSRRLGITEVREIIGSGYEWMLWLAVAGVITAIFNSLLPDTLGPTRAQRLVIIGSALGILVPAGILLSARSIVGFLDSWRFMDIFMGPAPVLFSFACVVALVYSLASKISVAGAAEYDSVEMDTNTGRRTVEKAA